MQKENISRYSGKITGEDFSSKGNLERGMVKVICGKEFCLRPWI